MHNRVVYLLRLWSFVNCNCENRTMVRTNGRNLSNSSCEESVLFTKLIRVKIFICYSVACMFCLDQFWRNNYLIFKRFFKELVKAKLLFFISKLN